jgi:Fe-S cluster assembly protein SufD
MWLTTCVENQHADVEWLRDLQQQLAHDFLARGIPSRREEEWKYTDIAFLLKKSFIKSPILKTVLPTELVVEHRLKNMESILVVLVNGHFVDSLSDLRLLPEGVTLCSLKQAFQQQTALVKNYVTANLNLQKHPFATVNAALMTDGVFLHAPKNTMIAATIHILNLHVEENNIITCPRNMIIVGEHAEVTLLEEHISSDAAEYFTNVVTDISADVGAKVRFHKIQHESENATHIAQIFVKQKQDSVVETHSLAVGSRLGREDVFVSMNASGAQSYINGFYCLTRDNQHIDNHIHIDHVAAHGTSSMLYKGIIDKKARAVFNGKIYVHKDAQKTQSYQANHNLLLSAEAEIDTKPEFEIYADDVKCAHGDTVGQLNMDMLFYLRSRGLDKAAAMKLLTYAFAADVMNKISHPQIKQHMTTLLNETLL